MKTKEFWIPLLALFCCMQISADNVGTAQKNFWVTSPQEQTKDDNRTLQSMQNSKTQNLSNERSIGRNERTDEDFFENYRYGDEDNIRVPNMYLEPDEEPFDEKPLPK